LAGSGVCNGNIIDASVASSGITVVGNIAGVKSVTSGSNPTGYLTVSTATTVPSVSISANSTNINSGGSVTFTPTPVNGGTNPTYKWYVNNVLTTTNNGPLTLNNVTAQTSVYCKMISNLACSNAQYTSQTLTITVSFAGFEYASSSFYQYTGTVTPGSKKERYYLWQI
jgi:hypothetical protein